MELAPSITLEQNTQPKSYHVYYNEWNGELISISRSKRKDINAPYIISDNSVCKTIIRGEGNTSDYRVSFNSDDELVLMKKDQVLRIQSVIDDVFMVPKLSLNAKMPSYDVKITVYTKNKKMVVSINDESISRLVNMSNRMELLVESTNDLDLYITKYNFPDFFVGKLKVDPAELLERGYIVYDLSVYTNLISMTDLGILTKRCFKSYVMNFVNAEFDEHKHTRSGRNHRTYHTSQVEIGNAGHLILTQTGNRVTINTDLTITELKEIGLYKSTLEIHVVGDTPDYYYDTLKINVDDLKRARRTTVTCEYDLSSCNMIHAKDYVLVTFNNGED